MLDERTKKLILYVARRIQWDTEARNFLIEIGGHRNEAKDIDGMTWANAAGNHAFDDHPEKFDFKEMDGHCIRAAFQQNEKECIQYLWEIGAVNLMWANVNK